MENEKNKKEEVSCSVWTLVFIRYNQIGQIISYLYMFCTYGKKLKMYSIYIYFKINTFLFLF